MRQATVNDIRFMNLVARECDTVELPKDVMDSAICYVGEHGFFVLDIQDETNAIVHVAILPQGRGLWAGVFFDWLLHEAFTATRIERISTMIPASWAHVRRFALTGGMRLVCETNVYAYYDIDIVRWMSRSDACLREGQNASSDFRMSDNDMVKRVSGACAIMSKAGMPQKAWYIYQLYAKLFGYAGEA